MTINEMILFGAVAAVAVLFYAFMLDVPQHIAKPIRSLMDKIWWRKIRRDYERWFPDED